MRTLITTLLATASVAAALTCQADNHFNYPDTARGKQQDNYHGTVVADPYRWLEDDVRESAAVADWVESQNALTFSYLDKLPARDTIEKRLTELWNFERYSVPVKRGDYYHYSHNNGLQNQNIIYRTLKLGGPAETVLDPNGWSEDGTVALGGIEFSPSGRYVAYGIQDGGSDWRSWRVKDLQSGKVLKDELHWIKFSDVSWTADETGFYYGRYPEPQKGAEFQGLNKNMSLWFHRIGSAQSEDRKVHARPDQPDWGFQASASANGRYLVITTWLGTDSRYRLEYIDLKSGQQQVVTLEDKFEADYSLIEVVGSEAYFRSTREAPRARIIKIDLADPQARGWQEVVAEQEQVLDGAHMVGDKLVLTYLQDAHSRVAVHDLAGKPLREVSLPGIGSAGGFPTDLSSGHTHYSYSSFNQPTTIYRYDVNSGKSELALAPKVPFNAAEFEVKQEFFSSRDGTRVPMFIAYKKGLKLDGKRPTLLYGYGGFNISLTPYFSITRLAWMDMGGVYAMANLRGGGEYGEEWHEAGTKLLKQNVFDDFIAAAEALIDRGYTNPDKLAVMGGSNGGLLVGATINQRPELFAAALPAVGVMDMLRFHKFTAGRFWVDDYGSADDAEEFKALYAYSPYHNISDGVGYPATLVTTADTDDRVVPGHSFKYIARLQQAQAGEDPVLIRIQTRAGHGSGKPTSMVIREYADMWAFLVEHLGME